MAEPPLPRTAPLQGGTGTRPAHPDRQGGTSAALAHHRLGPDDALPQQTRIHLRTAALDDLRRDSGRRRHRRGRRTGLPHSRQVRQGTRHPRMLAAAGPLERNPAGNETLLPGTRLQLLRHPRTPRPDAQPRGAHLLHGRSHGHRRIRRGRPRTHRGPARPLEGAVSGNHLADVHGQYEAERLDGRHRRPPVERPRPHLRGDGGAAFQDRPEVVLPDQLRTGLRALQGGPQFRGADGRGNPL